MAEKIKLGIIGAGKVTTLPGRHIDSVLSLNDSDVEIMAVADSYPGLAKKVAEKFAIPYYFENYHDLLQMEEINAVTINTPTNTHKQIAIDCILANKNVYVEKPITSNEEELREVLSYAKKSNIIFIGGSNGLLQRQMGIFKSMIDSGKLGEVYMLSVDRASGRNNEYGMETKKTVSNIGISVHSGSHNVEWALYLLGDPKPVSVISKGYYREDNLSIPPKKCNGNDDCCIAMVFFDNGSSFVYKALRAAPVKDIYEMKIYGDKMTITYDVNKCYKEKSNDCIQFYQHDNVIGMQEVIPEMICGKTHADMYCHFFSCIREKKESFSNGDRGLVTMRILDAISKSIKLGGKQVYIK